MGLSGLEPPTSRLSGVRSNRLSYKPICGSFLPSGDEEIRTLDPLLARQVLSQLSYIPMGIWQPPALPHRLQCSTIGRLGLNRRVRDGNGCVPQAHRRQKFSLSARAGLVAPSIPLRVISVESSPLIQPVWLIRSRKQACIASVPAILCTRSLITKQ